MEWLEALRPQLEAAVATFVSSHGAPGAAVGIVVGDELAWSFGYGFADLTTAAPPDERTVFRIASITKTFTATAILQLRDEGLLRLDDPLVARLPEFAAATNPFGPIEEVTLRRLLLHESGLMTEPPLQDWETRHFATIDETLAHADRIRLVIPPDSRTKYSNLGFQLLGEVVQRVAGIGFRDYVRAGALEPLEMRDTGFELSGRISARTALGYDAPLFVEEPRESDGRDKPTDAEGGLWSTVTDLARWISLQFRTDGHLERGGSQVLRGPTLAEMHRARIVTDDAWTSAQGLGWYQNRRDGYIAVGHAGGTPGFTSRIAFSALDGLGVVVLLNGEAVSSTLALDLLDRAVEAARAVPRVPPPIPPAPVPDCYRELLGIYHWREGGEGGRVEWRGGRLRFLWTGDPETLVELEPTEDSLVFLIHGGRETGETAIFLRGSSGTVETLKVTGHPLRRLK